MKSILFVWLRLFHWKVKVFMGFNQFVQLYTSDNRDDNERAKWSSKENTWPFGRAFENEISIKIFSFKL